MKLPTWKPNDDSAAVRCVEQGLVVAGLSGEGDVLAQRLHQLQVARPDGRRRLPCRICR